MMATTQTPDAWEELSRRIEACTACPRLVEHCRDVAATKRAAYREWDYWGKPVANFGDPAGRLLIVGLAPGAHGANRTGRIFTGDASGDWLFRAMHRAGFASQPHASDRNDGLRLLDCAITGVGHCAPPDNKLTGDEVERCRPWLQQTFDMMGQARVFLALGSLAWRELVREVDRRGWRSGKLPPFGHGQSADIAGGRRLLASYHPSRQNTNTGVLTERMLDDVFEQARTWVQQLAPGH